MKRVYRNNLEHFLETHWFKHANNLQEEIFFFFFFIKLNALTSCWMLENNLHYFFHQATGLHRHLHHLNPLDYLAFRIHQIQNPFDQDS
jgi:hypothetical protein